jgi:hypothetical protein
MPKIGMKGGSRADADDAGFTVVWKKATSQKEESKILYGKVVRKTNGLYNHK